MKTLFTLCLSCIFLSAFAQDKNHYNFGIGLRAGETSGLTIKGFLSEHVALDGIVGYWNRQPAVTILAERHFEPFHRLRNINLYVGGGLHVAGATGYNRWYNLRNESYDYRNGGVGYGADIIAGFEFKFPVLPVAVSFDIKPFMELSTEGGVFAAFDPGVGIKLAL